MNSAEIQASPASEPVSQDAHFRPFISMGMRYDVWLTADSLRLKQGMRKTEVALADVTHFGVKRFDDDRTALTELRLVTSGKTHKLPFHTGDDQAHALLAALQARRPDADVSAQPWADAAPRLGIKPYGFRDYLSQPMAAAGLGMLVLAGPAVFILNAVFPAWSPPSTRGIATGVVMITGVVLMVIGYTRLRKRRATELGARPAPPTA